MRGEGSGVNKRVFWIPAYLHWALFPANPCFVAMDTIIIMSAEQQGDP